VKSRRCTYRFRSIRYFFHITYIRRARVASGLGEELSSDNQKIGTAGLLNRAVSFLWVIAGAPKSARSKPIFQAMAHPCSRKHMSCLTASGRPCETRFLLYNGSVTKTSLSVTCRSATFSYACLDFGSIIITSAGFTALCQITNFTRLFRKIYV
jgi:hypothetical protein